MSSTLSTLFYVFTLGIPLIVLGVLVFLYYNPAQLLQLTSKSGLAVDLTGVNTYNPATAATVLGTEAGAVVKIGANSYSVANDTVGLAYLANALVAPTAVAKAAADDLAASTIKGTLTFWIIMLAVGALGLVFAYIGISHPEWLFGDQVGALISYLPKTNTCNSGSCSIDQTSPATITPTAPPPINPAWMNPVQSPVLVQQPTQPAPPSYAQLLAMYAQQTGAPAQQQPDPQAQQQQPQTGMPAQNQFPQQQVLPIQPPLPPAQQPQITTAQLQAMIQALMAQQQVR